MTAAKTTAERVAALRQRRQTAGLVRVDLYLSADQRDKLARLGGQAWIQERIKRAKEPNA